MIERARRELIENPGAVRAALDELERLYQQARAQGDQGDPATHLERLARFDRAYSAVRAKLSEHEPAERLLAARAAVRDMRNILAERQAIDQRAADKRRAEIDAERLRVTRENLRQEWADKASKPTREAITRLTERFGIVGESLTRIASEADLIAALRDAKVAVQSADASFDLELRDALARQRRAAQTKEAA